MKRINVTSERWREYDFGGRVYRIDQPTEVIVGATTHRVIDAAGIVHCVPAPGFHGCVLRWLAVAGDPPVTA